MANRKRILAISGSVRADSVNLRLIAGITERVQDWAEVSLSPPVTSLPHFDPDVTDFAPEIEQFRASIRAADAVLICTPEYVFSLPGSLKNALEWTVGDSTFSKKPVALITASGMGATAHESLCLVMKTIEAEFDDATQLLISNSRSKVGAGGEITDAATAEAVDSLLSALRKRLDE